MSLVSLHRINSYLTDRYLFAQIEDKKSALTQVMCVVLQGSMLGPMPFNLYVIAMSTFTSSTCLQFADDITVYKRCKVIPDCANIIQNNVEHLKAWSDVNSLAFNGTKITTMIFSTRRMSRYHHLNNGDTYSAVLNRNEAESRIERKGSMKILRMKVDQHLTWEEHVANVIKSSYDNTLLSLKILKRYIPYKPRKTAEACILLKIDYGSVVYQNVPKFLIKRLQKVPTISAGYVLNRYTKECDVEFNKTKLAFKALHCPEWPDYLTLLRNSDVTNYLTLTIKTHLDLMLAYFNDVPLDPRKEIDSYLVLKAFSLIMHLQGFRSFVSF